MLYVFENLIKTTIVCSLGICLLLFLKRYLFKKFSKRFNYYIWLIIVFRMLLFLFNYTIVYEVKEPKENALGNNITQIDISTDNNLMLYVAYLWLFVTIVIAVYTFIKYTRFKNLVVDVSYDIEDNDINCIYKNLLKELNIKKKIELRGSDELISPAGMGLFKSYIFLPDYSYSKSELTWILKHELMHFKNKDILIKFLVLSVRIIYWFNPLVYVMSNRGILLTDFNRTNLEKRLESIISKKFKNSVFVVIILCLLSSITYFKFDIFISKPVIYSLPKPSVLNDEYIYNTDIRVER